jgi:HEAT repeat protein
VVERIDGLLRAGQFQPAAMLACALAAQAAADAPRSRRPFAQEALSSLADEELVRRALLHLKSSDAEDTDTVKRLLDAIGPAVVGPVIAFWSTERDARLRRTMQEIVLGFGARGRDSVQKLIDADDWEVRRTAVQLLRACGGGRSLRVLAPLLGDADPRVRRDAFRAVALEGDEAAFAAIERAWNARSDAIRESVREEMSALTDPRAAPFLCHMVHRLDYRHAWLEESLALIDLLGDHDTLQSVDALRGALSRSVWWPFGRSRAFHEHAARALLRIGTPAAAGALEQIAATGRGSARSVARRAVAQRPPDAAQDRLAPMARAADTPQHLRKTS